MRLREWLLCATRFSSLSDRLWTAFLCSGLSFAASVGRVILGNPLTATGSHFAFLAGLRLGFL